jgi:hypothetical protein
MRVQISHDAGRQVQPVPAMQATLEEVILTMKTMTFTTTRDTITITRPNAAMLRELLCRTRKIKPFLRSKSPTGDKDFCYDEFHENEVVMTWHYWRTMFGMELLAFVEAIDEASFTKHSKAAMLKRLFDAFQPWPGHDHPGAAGHEYRGCYGINVALDDPCIMNQIKDHFNPAPGVMYASATTSACETTVKMARQFEISYTFTSTATVAEMMDVLANGPVEEEAT